MKTWQQTRNTLAAAVVGLVLLPAGGCLFEPREAEPPRAGQQIEYLVQRDAANVWANIETALEAQDVAGWQAQLSPDFTATDVSDDTGAWAGLTWDYDREVAFATAFFTQVTAIQADMRDTDFSVEQPTGQGDWDIIYRITVTEADGSTTTYRARATITFKLEGNFWYILTWTDVQGEEYGGATRQTLGVLRTSIASR